MSEADLLKKEISQMQSQIHYLQIRVKELKEQINVLSKGESSQLELF